MDPELHHLWVRFETALQTCLDSGGPARRHRAQGRPAVCVLRPLMALEILAAHHSNKSASECGLLYKSPRSVSVDLYQGFYSSATGSQQNRKLSGSSNMTMQTAGRGLVVRGPVHGYLSVAAHKRLVVDTPITQRLRRIAQTGLAEMSSPKQKHRGSFLAWGPCTWRRDLSWQPSKTVRRLTLRVFLMKLRERSIGKLLALIEGALRLTARWST